MSAPDQKVVRDQVGIVVAGTAGQPIYEVARTLADALARPECSVSVSGNPDARPGQTVEAHARTGPLNRPPGPRVMPGECQLVVGLEPLEAIRAAIRYFTPGMLVVSLGQTNAPTTVMHRGMTYPDITAASESLRLAGVHVSWVEDGPDSESLVAGLLLAGREAVARLTGRRNSNPNSTNKEN